MARTQRSRRSPAERVSAKAGAAARSQSPSARGGFGAKPAPAPGQAPGSSLPPAQSGIGSWSAPRPGDPAAKPMVKGATPIAEAPGPTTGGNPIPAPMMKGPPPGALSADGADPARGTRPRPRWVGAATGPRVAPGVREAPAGRSMVGGEGDAGAGPSDTDPSRPMRMGRPGATTAPGAGPVNFATGLLAPWGGSARQGLDALNTHSGGANVPPGYGNAPPFGGAAKPMGVGMPAGLPEGGMVGGLGGPPTAGGFPAPVQPLGMGGMPGGPLAPPGGVTSSPRTPMPSPWGPSGGIMKPMGQAPGPRLQKAIQAGQVSPEIARLALQ